MTLTVESARAELRAARIVYRCEHIRARVGITLFGRGAAEQHGLRKLYESARKNLLTAHRRYQYARCIDLDYALRLKKHGVNPAELSQ